MVHTYAGAMLSGTWAWFSPRRVPWAGPDKPPTAKTKTSRHGLIGFECPSIPSVDHHYLALLFLPQNPVPVLNLLIIMSASADHGLSSLVEAVRASLAPLDENSQVSASQDHTGLVADMRALGFSDYGTLVQFLNSSATGINDDNKLLLERLVQLLAKLPPQSKQLKSLSGGFINQLWTTLDHPPVCTLDDKYKYRQADGSYNNIHDPRLGAANTPFARSVKPTNYQRPDLPQPDVIFERLSGYLLCLSHPDRLTFSSC
jgi:hypothetical protein